MKKVFIKTFGCQMNEQDSVKMLSLLQQDGYARTYQEAEADLFVINTCSIREKAYHKAVSTIGKHRKMKRMDGRTKPVIAITGCVVSHDGAALMKRFPFVDIALGPDHVDSLPALVKQVSTSTQEKILLTDFKDISDYEFPTPIFVPEASQRQAKAYVTIMKGCDNRCSFCIVPFVRGDEVSRTPESILEEIHRLEEQGVREVMLLGQNVNSYGKGLAPSKNFAQLLRLIDEKTSLARIRYISPHPKDLSQDLIEEYKVNEKLCPQIHLPVQSGSSRILKKMRRSYTRGVYLRKVEQLRMAVPEVAMTTDIIVGFPGETEEDFEDTLSLVREVAFDASYSFTFSPRPQTEAFSFPNDVPEEVKKERLGRLQKIQEDISQKKNDLTIGRVESVLVESPSLEASGQVMGRTPQGRIVNFNGDVSWVGDILNVKITWASAYSLKGACVPQGVLC